MLTYLVLLEEMVGQQVVIDLLGPYVCLDKLVGIDDRPPERINADFHDLRDTQ